MFSLSKNDLETYHLMLNVKVENFQTRKWLITSAYVGGGDGGGKGKKEEEGGEREE